MDLLGLHDGDESSTPGLALSCPASLASERSLRLGQWATQCLGGEASVGLRSIRRTYSRPREAERLKDARQLDGLLWAKPESCRALFATVPVGAVTVVVPHPATSAENS